MLLFYGWQVLSRVTILGVSHTAPFSSWSFGDFLSRIVPLLWIGSLFFLTFFTSGKARRAAVLTDAAPMEPRRYALARCGAALAGTALLALAALAEAAVFYGWYFGWYGWMELITPALVTLAPPLVFALGSGWLLGRVRFWLLYVWMPLPFALALLPLPEVLELWNGSFFTQYPLTLGTLDPAFTLPHEHCRSANRPAGSWCGAVGNGCKETNTIERGRFLPTCCQEAVGIYLIAIC